MEVENADTEVIGYESIMKDGKAVGYVTSGAFGHCIGKSIAAGYVPTALARDGEKFEIDILGETRTAIVRREPMFDPQGLRLRPEGRSYRGRRRVHCKRSPHAGSAFAVACATRSRGPLRDVIACHCSQCRRTSGHFVAASGAPTAAIKLIKAETLTWYRSSAAGAAGVLQSLWRKSFLAREQGKDWTSIMAGTLDPPTGLRIVEHIFVEDKSDYYSIGAASDRG